MLLITAAAVTFKAPVPLQVVAPGVLRTREELRILPAAPPMARPPLAWVVPAPDIVPPVQVASPETVRLPLPESVPALSEKAPATWEALARESVPPDIPSDPEAVTVTLLTVCVPDGTVTLKPSMQTSSETPGSTLRSQFAAVCQTPVPAELSKLIVPGHAAASGAFGAPGRTTSTALAFPAIGPTRRALGSTPIAPRVEPAMRTAPSAAIATVPGRSRAAIRATTRPESGSSVVLRETTTPASVCSAIHVCPSASADSATRVVSSGADATPSAASDPSPSRSAGNGSEVPSPATRATKALSPSAAGSID